MTRAALLLAAGVTVVMAQYDPLKPLSPEVILLARIKVVASEVVARTPDFTCSMTIERSRRRGAKRFELVDNLRLDVAFVGGKELYAFPGARKFEERELHEWIGNEAAIGTGDFTSHLQSVLFGGGATFEYRGEETAPDRKLQRFDFSVAIDRSRYTMRMNNLEAVVGYRGSLWVDSVSMDVTRLELVVTEIPFAIPLRACSKVIEMSRRKIGETEFLLPVRSELHMTTTDGTESRNRTEFTDCRQFRGESTLSFDDPAPDAAPKQPSIQWTLPEGLPLRLRLKQVYDTKKAVKGDAIPLVAARDIMRNGKMEVPKGAEFLARLDQIYCEQSARPNCFLALKLESFQFENKEGVVRGRLETPRFDPQTDAPARRMLVPEFVVAPAIEQGVLLIRGGRIPIPAGFELVWSVLPPP